MIEYKGQLKRREELEEFSQEYSQENSRWYALWTYSNCEQKVHDQLRDKGYLAFLPKMPIWSRRGKLRHLIHTPMFPGYLFLKHCMDPQGHTDILKAKGLVRILGESWDQLAVIPDSSIEAIKRILTSKLHAEPYPYLKEGQRVRITRGPLADMEGILLRTSPTKGLFVVSVNLLRRSVAVEVDCTLVIGA